MTGFDAEELELLEAYERGELRSVATPERLAWLKDVGKATGVKDRRINVRVSSTDLRAIQARALEEGMPYQTLIASVMHKYVTGRLVDGDDPKRAA